MPVNEKELQKNRRIEILAFREQWQSSQVDAEHEITPRVTAAMLQTTIVPALSNLRQQEETDFGFMLEALECLKNYVANDSPVEITLKEHKALFVSSGALEETIQSLRICMERTETKEATTTLEILSYLSSNASDTLKNDHFLPGLHIIHGTMTAQRYSASIQRFGCNILRNLSNPLLQELVAAGSVFGLMNAMKNHPDDALVQEHGSATLYNLLPLCPITTIAHNPEDAPVQDHDGRTDSVDAVLLSTIVLRGMERHADVVPVQQYGLLVLKRLCQKDQETYETILSKGGLAILLNQGMSSLALHDECLAQLTCQFLRDFSRQSSLDIVRAIAAKGGFVSILNLMQHHVSSINIQDPAMACLRNLCIHPDNRNQAVLAETEATAAGTDSSSAIPTMIPTVLATLHRYPHDAAIQAYGCDVLGLLALLEEGAGNILERAVEDGNDLSAITIALAAMNEHRHHAGVQDRAIFLLVNLCESHDAAVDRLVQEYTSPMSTSTSTSTETGVSLDSFLRATHVPPRGVERRTRLVTLVAVRQTAGGPSLSSSNDDFQDVTPLPDKENVINNFKGYLSRGWKFVGQGRTASNMAKPTTTVTII